MTMPETVEATDRARPGPHPALVFAAALSFTVLSLGSGVLLLTRASPSGETEGAPATGDVAVTSAPRAQSPAAGSPRVLSASGTAEAAGDGAYRVAFVWDLEGARLGDAVVVRFFVRQRLVSEQEGTLDPNVFTASTGRLVITTSQPCSTEGWSAELFSVREQRPGGDAIARVAGVTCR